MVSQEGGRRIVRAANGVVNAIVVVALVALFAIGCYALWDSHQVDSRADSVSWQPYKPVEPEPLSFWELQDLNPDVKAWLSVYGTRIDYPVCQAEDGAKYLDTDAKGEYSLTGALFMEPSSAADFSDFATFVYGHHMEHDVMFGQVTDFLDQAFFDDHRYGNLFVEDRDWGIEFICCLSADAYDSTVYRTSFSDEADQMAYAGLLAERAACKRAVEVGPGDRMVLLSTCSTEQTNGRTVLVGKVVDGTFEDSFTVWPNAGTGVDGAPGWLGAPWYGWLLLASAVALVVLMGKGRKRNA